MLSLLGNVSNHALVLQQPWLPLLYVISLTALAWVAYQFSKLLDIGTTRHTRLPPGPPDRWFKPGAKASLKYEQMIREYGPVFSYRQGGNVVVVIGRFQEAVDIMQKHGGELADRPKSIAAGEIFSGGMRTLLTPYGDRLRKLRRALHSQLQLAVTHQWVPIQWKYARMHILDLLSKPEQHTEHARRYAASVIMTLTYGKRTPSNYSDPEVQAIVKNGLELGKLLAKTHIVDVYPILKYIPYFTSDLRQGFKADHDLYTSQVNGVRKQVEAGQAQQSFVTYLLDHQKELGLNDKELAFLGGSMFGAGAETTASAISFAVMAACKYPEEQVKVHAQLDEVIGRDRVPTKEDGPLLSRVTAFYLEAYRWRPVSWGGFAHRATKDIIWRDFIIPAGAAVVGSHWCIAKDPEIYPDPYLFKPDRFLDREGKVRDDLVFWNFGFGRRVCPGQHVANNSLFLNIALILWAFKVSEDPSSPIDDMAFMDAANTRPYPFKVIFTPRFPDLRQVVETSLAQTH